MFFRISLIYIMPFLKVSNNWLPLTSHDNSMTSADQRAWVNMLYWCNLCFSSCYFSHKKGSEKHIEIVESEFNCALGWPISG